MIQVKLPHPYVLARFGLVGRDEKPFSLTFFILVGKSNRIPAPAGVTPFCMVSLQNIRDRFCPVQIILVFDFFDHLLQTPRSRVVSKRKAAPKGGFFRQNSKNLEKSGIVIPFFYFVTTRWGNPGDLGNLLERFALGQKSFDL